MPELPEVETVARTLAPHIAGKTIVTVNVLYPATVQGNISLQALTGACIDAQKPTSRRGKLLFVHCSPKTLTTASDTVGNALQDPILGFAVHLKMTGKVFVHPAGIMPHAHTRAVLVFDDQSQLFFDDARKFGYLRVLSSASIRTWAFFQKLGPEPLEIDAQDFVRRFEAKRGKIKALLLDQAVIAGCGNIYADEALFRAGIRPDTSASTLGAAQLTRLHGALQAVLWESIAACGSSIRDYRTANGDVGAFQNAFTVYGRAGQACTQCGQILQKMQVAGRTTVFCPHCQGAL